jgi:uncharacterized spore protein YtfJ
MDPTAVMEQTQDLLTVNRVFGEPYERDGLTIIPAAAIRGGAGGGSGEGGDDGETGQGSGAGFGVRATPAGLVVIRGEEVTWQPALDLNRVIVGGQVVAVVLLLVLRSILRRR